MSETLDFNPTPDLEAKILDALFSEHHSLASVATLAATSIEALTLWLARPAIRTRIAEVESFAAWRVRFVATMHLTKAMSALTEVLDNPNFKALSQPAPSPAHEPAQSAPAPSNASRLAPEARTALLRHRTYESVRRAASTLVHLARFKPIGPTAVVPASANPSTSVTPARSSSATVASAPTPPPPSQPQAAPALPPIFNPANHDSIDDFLNFLESRLPPEPHPTHSAPPAVSALPHSTPARGSAHASAPGEPENRAAFNE